MIQSFKNYIRNQEENDVINEVKKEILLMLYNNKGLVLKNSKKYNKDINNLEEDMEIQNSEIENTIIA